MSFSSLDVVHKVLKRSSRRPGSEFQSAIKQELGLAPMCHLICLLLG
jgi:hypothetical protein